MTVFAKKRKIFKNKHSSSPKAKGDVGNGRDKIFKYESFPQQLSKIDISLFFQASSLEEISDDPTFSYFRHALISLKELDCTDDYASFCAKVNDWTMTLAQVLFHKNELVELVLLKLQTTSIATATFLKLLACLVKDLHEDFFPFLERSMQALFCIIDLSTEAPVVQSAFHCLLYTFKFLHRPMMKNILSVFSSFTPFLSHKRGMIRSFSAEAVSYLMRKLKDEQQLAMCIELFLDSALDIDILSLFFFHCVKGVQHGLHSSAPLFFQTLIHAYLNSSREDDFSIVSHTFLTVLYHTGEEQHALHVWEGLLSSSSSWTRSGELTDMVRAQFFILCSRMIYLKKGSLSVPFTSLKSLIHDYMSDPMTKKNHDILTAVADLLTALLSHATLEHMLTLWIPLLSSMSIGTFPLAYRFRMYQSLDWLEWPLQDCFAAQREKDFGATNIHSLCLPLYLSGDGDDLLTTKRFDDEISISLEDVADELLKISSLKSRLPLLTTLCTMFIMQHAHRRNGLSLAWLQSQRTKSASPIVSMLAVYLMEQLDEVDNVHLLLDYWHQLYLMPRYLTVLVKFIQRIASPSQLVFPHDWLPNLCQLLASTDEKMRRSSLFLLSMTLYPASALVDLLILIHDTPCTLELYRDKILKLNRLLEMISSKSKEQWAHSDILVVFSFLFGTLYIPFQLIHQDVMRIIGTIAKAWPDIFWSCFKKQYEPAQPDTVVTLAALFPSLTSEERQTLSEWIHDSRLDITDASKLRSKHITECDGSGSLLPYIRDYGLHRLAILQERLDQCRHFPSLMPLSISILADTDPVSQKASCPFIQSQCLALLASLTDKSLLEREYAHLIGLMRNANNKDTSTILKILAKIPSCPLEQDQLYEEWIKLLSHADPSTQTAALHCLFTLPSVQNVLKISAHCRSFFLTLLGSNENDINDVHGTTTKWQDAILGVKEKLPAAVDHPTAYIFYSILVNIVYGKMIHHSYRGNEQQSTVRKKLLRWVAGDLPPLAWDLLYAQATKSLVDNEIVSTKKIIGLVHFLHDYLTVLGQQLTLSRRVSMLKLLVSLMKQHQQFSISSVDRPKTFRHIKKQMMALVVILYKLMAEDEDMEMDDQVLQYLIQPILLPACDSIDKALLELVTIFSFTPQRMPILFKTIDSTGQHLFSYLLHVAKNELTDTKVLVSILKICNNIYQRMPCQLRAYQELFEHLVANLIAKPITPELAAPYLQLFTDCFTMYGDQFSSPLHRQALVSHLISLLKKPKTANQQVVSLLAHVVSLDCMAPSLDDPTFLSLCSLFSCLKSTELRCQLVTTIFKKIELAPTIIALLEKLNRPELTFRTHLDAHIAVDAQSPLSTLKEHRFSCVEWLLVLNNLFFYCSHNDIATSRHQAIAMMSRFIDDVSIDEQFISRHFIPWILGRIASFKTEEPLRRDLLVLFERLVVKRLPVLHCLIMKDEEANILSNLCHIQLHRRQRALLRLSEMQKLPSSFWISKLLIPLALQATRIFSEERSGNSIAPLIDQAILTTAKLTCFLPWKKYRQSLLRYMSWWLQASGRGGSNIKKKMSSRHATFPSHPQWHIKSIVKLTIQTIHCRFGVDGSILQDDDERELILERLIPNLLTLVVVTQEKSTMITGLKETRASEPGGRSVASIQHPVAECIVKLLLYLNDEDQTERYLPKIVFDICQFLRSRVDHVRQDAREALVKISILLGARYIGFIVRQMQSILVNKKSIHHGGFLRHILGYTVYAILVGFSSRPQPTKPRLDDETVSLLVDVLLDDVLGIIAIEKETEEWTNKAKEVKQKKGNEAFYLLSKHMSIESIQKALIQRIQLARPSVEGLKAQTVRVRTLLGKVASGLAVTATVSPLKSIYDVMNIESSTFFCPSLLVEFGLLLLCKALQQSAHLDIALLDPFVGLVCSRFLKSDENGNASVSNKTLNLVDDEILVCSYKALILLARLPLPSFTRAALRGSIDFAFRALSTRKSIAAAGSLSSKCFKWIAMVMRGEVHYSDGAGGDIRSAFRLNERQVKLLITHCILPDLENMGGTAHSLIKCILSQHLLLPEVYDLLDRIRTPMIISENGTIREHCRGLYVQFLTEYPMTREKRLHLFEYFFENMAHEWESVRRNVLLFFRSILEKDAVALVDDAAASLLFLHLTLRLVNEASQEVSRQLTSLIVLLFQYMSKHEREDMMKSIICLIKDWRQTNPVLRNVSVRLVLLLFESSRYHPTDQDIEDWLMPMLCEALALTSSPELVLTGWALLSSIMEKAPVVYKSLAALPLVDSVEQWLTTSDVKNAAMTKAMNRYFYLMWTADESVRIHFKRTTQEEAQHKLVTWLDVWCAQLYSPNIEWTVSTADITVKIIFSICRALLPISASFTVLKDCLCQLSKWLRVTHFKKNQQSQLLLDLAMEQYRIRQRAVFKLIAAITSLVLPSTFCERPFSCTETEELLMIVMGTCCRLDSSSKLQTDHLSSDEDSVIKSLAHELLSLIEKRLDADDADIDYARLFEKTHTQVSLERKSRKEKMKRKAVTNPAAYTRRKVARNKLKSTQKQQKKRLIKSSIS